MKGWLDHHRAALFDALSRMARAPFAAFFTLVAIGVALSLPAALYLTLANLNQLAGQVPAQPEITVFISATASPGQQTILKQKIESLPGLSKRRYISRDTALKNLASQGLGDVTAGLESNPLPDAWALTPATSDVATLEKLRKELEALSGVERVLADSAWAQRLQTILAIGQRVVLILTGLFGIALVAISSNAIRAQILGRQEEIEVSRLIGATDRYIRRPFLYFGALEGFLGGLMALVIIATMQWLLAPPVSQLATLYGSPYRLLGLDPAIATAILGGAVLFSWLGAWLAVNRSLHRLD